jgi:hypothetical protein
MLSSSHRYFSAPSPSFDSKSPLSGSIGGGERGGGGGGNQDSSGLAHFQQHKEAGYGSTQKLSPHSLLLQQQHEEYLLQNQIQFPVLSSNIPLSTTPPISPQPAAERNFFVMWISLWYSKFELFATLLRIQNYGLLVCCLSSIHFINTALQFSLTIFLIIGLNFKENDTLKFQAYLFGLFFLATAPTCGVMLGTFLVPLLGKLSDAGFASKFARSRRETRSDLKILSYLALFPFISGYVFIYLFVYNDEDDNNINPLLTCIWCVGFGVCVLLAPIEAVLSCGVKKELRVTAYSAVNYFCDAYVNFFFFLCECFIY